MTENNSHKNPKQRKINPLRMIQAGYRGIVSRDSSRTTGGIIFSLIIHATVIVLMLGVATFEKPEEPPIREISFVDYTEKVEEPVQAKKKNRIREPELEPEQEFPVPPTPAVEERNVQRVATISLDGNRLELEKKPVNTPINLERHASIASDVKNSADVLRISDGKGKTPVGRAAIPAQIKLDTDKKLLFASMDQKNAGIPKRQNTNPSIKLDAKKLTNPPVVKTVSLTSKPEPMKKQDPFATLKQSQTFITGPLANRSIVNKIIPQFPHWAKRQGVGATISLQFTVMEDGSVKENIIVERTSGSGEWDKMVIAALKKWQFASLAKTGVRHDQTGTITFQFVI